VNAVLSGRNKIKVDVLDASLDEKVAPSLGGAVIGIEHRIYSDPLEFFKRTLITESMAEILESVANVVSEGRGSKVILLSAFFGGGKTHTLLALYHAIKNPDALLLAHAESEDIRKRIRNVVERLRNVEVIVIDGTISRLAPTPLNPLDAGTYKVNTLWGYIAHALGRYDDFKKFDQDIVPPQVDDIVRLLSGRRLVIIVDEIAQYVQRLYDAKDEAIKGYAKNVVLFFEGLVKAVDVLTNIALVISLPAKVSAEGEVEEVEAIYRSDIVSSLIRAIHRVSVTHFEPVKPRDIPALLRVRLFDEVDLARAKEVAEILRREYDRNKNVFEDVRPELIVRIKESYPFHPLYIDVLLDILDKHRGLQKTRDLLRISRKVIRAIISDHENVYDLVMPWHIDVERDDIRSLLLSSGYEMFRLPIEEDIVERCSNYAKPWIAKIVAKALFIKTFVYGGGLVPKAEFFPTPEELALLIYEPGLFTSKDAQPKDIVEAIDWMTNNLLYVLKDERTRRLWFTNIVSPVKLIEERVQRVTDAEAYKKVLGAIDDLLSEPLDAILGRRGRKDVIKLFDVEGSRVSRECKSIDHDARKYIVYVCLDLDVAKRREILEEITYRTSSGGTRRYANTIYIVYPDRRERLLQALDYAKKVIVCEEVERENIVDSLLKGLEISVQELEIAKEIYRSKINKYCENAEIGFYNLVLSALSKVTYPAMKDTTRTIEETDIAIGTTSIIYSVEQTLSRLGLKKIRLELDFDTFSHLLNSIGVNLNTTVRKVSDIIDYFYSNPKLPAVPEEVIREAIAEGVKKPEIGLRCGNRVYFKNIVTCESEEQCLQVGRVEGEPITSKAVADNCEVLPYVEALKDQMKGLEGREWYEGGVKIVEDYYIVLDKKLVSVKNVLESFEEYDPVVLKETPLVKLVRRVVVDIEPREHVVRARPGEEIQHKLVIKRSGPFRGVLRIRTSYGEVQPSTISIDERFTEGLVTWTLKVPTEPGSHSYVIELVAEDGRTIASARLNVVVEIIGREWYEGVPPEGTEVEIMKVHIDGRDLKPLNVLRSKLGASTIVRGMSLELSFAMRKDRVSRLSLSMNDVGLDDVAAIVLSIVTRFGLGEITARIDLEIAPAEGRGFKMPALSKEELDALSKHKIMYKPVKK
jgi:predicted AAA+ superfamily ATPase